MINGAVQWPIVWQRSRLGGADDLVVWQIDEGVEVLRRG